jgi:type VI secretion system protein ImpJ
MADPTLARPTWRIGQVLLPDHFLGLEAALAAEAALRAGLSGPPAYGVARLAWSADDLGPGVLWVSALTAVLPDGMLVDVPGNARVRGPLDLSTAGRGEVEVFAHIVDDDEAAAPLMDPPSKDIPRHVHLIELSTESVRRGSRGRIGLGLFTPGTGGAAFQLSPRVVPPLLRLDTTPYLAGRLTRLRGELSVLDRALDDRALDALGRGETLGPIQRARLEARKLGALLDDVANGVSLHPYVIYTAMRGFSLDLYLLDEHATPWHPPAYAHDDPARCFGAVFAELSSRMQVAPPQSSPVVPFTLDGGRLVAADLPPEALSAPEIYVAVLKARAGDQVPLEGVRFGSPGRLRLVREHALRGVRFVAAPTPPFRHGFGAAVDFYRLLTGAAGEAGEWAYVAHERALACHATPLLEGQRLVVCWRRP